MRDNVRTRYVKIGEATSTMFWFSYVDTLLEPEPVPLRMPLTRYKDSRGRWHGRGVLATPAKGEPIYSYGLEEIRDQPGISGWVDKAVTHFKPKYGNSFHTADRKYSVITDGKWRLGRSCYYISNGILTTFHVPHPDVYVTGISISQMKYTGQSPWKNYGYYMTRHQDFQFESRVKGLTEEEIAAYCDRITTPWSNRRDHEYFSCIADSFFPPREQIYKFGEEKIKYDGFPVSMEDDDPFVGYGFQMHRKKDQGFVSDEPTKNYLTEAYSIAISNIPKANDNNMQNVMSIVNGLKAIATGEISSPESWNDYWLWYRYVFGTTTMDSQEILNYLADQLKDEIVTSHGEVLREKARFHCEVKFRRYPNPGLYAFAEKLWEWGFANPLYGAWDSTPFSFMVDWVVPIGDMLKSIDDSIFLSPFYFDVLHCNFSISYESDLSNVVYDCYTRWPGRPPWETVSVVNTKDTVSVVDQYKKTGKKQSIGASDRTTLKRSVDCFAIFT